MNTTGNHRRGNRALTPNSTNIARKSVRPLKLLVVLIVAASVMSTLSRCAADDFPASVRNKTLSQMTALLKRASSEGMIITGINVRATRTRIVIDCSFEKNSAETEWLALFNMPGSEVDDKESEYTSNGYVRALEQTVNFRGQQLNSIVWYRHAKERPLTLPDTPLPESGLEDSRLTALDGVMRSFMSQYNVAGATIAIAKDRRLVYSRGFGYANVDAQQAMQPDTEMRIASISKSITGVAVMMLIQDGRLSLDQKIVPLLTDNFRIPSKIDERWNQITVRHLLQHAGGWDRGTSEDPMFQVPMITRKKRLRRPATQIDIINYQLAQPLDFDPGERYAYSNFGYCLLGRVIEVVTKKSYADFVTERILQPQQMRNTRLAKTRLEDLGAHEARYYMQTATAHSPFWEAVTKTRRGSGIKAVMQVEAPFGQWDIEVMDSNVGWVSNAPDLLRFVAGLDSPDRPLLSTESRETMLSQPQLKEHNTIGFSYGFGWNFAPAQFAESKWESDNIWHNGALAGTSTMLVRRFDGFSWAILFNTDTAKNGQRLADLIRPQIYRAVDRIAEWPDYDLFGETRSE